MKPGDIVCHRANLQQYIVESVNEGRFTVLGEDSVLFVSDFFVVWSE